MYVKLNVYISILTFSLGLILRYQFVIQVYKQIIVDQISMNDIGKCDLKEMRRANTYILRYATEASLIN